MTGMDQKAGFEILGPADFAEVTYSLVVRHPRMAKAARPGQFVIATSR
jgi:hypothetical protein